jgi:uncharacterized membrane protein
VEQNGRVHRQSAAQISVFSWVAGVLGALAAVGLILLRPTGDIPPAPALSSFEGVYRARIEDRNDRTCAGAQEGTRCIQASVRLLEGPDENTVVRLELPTSGRLEGLAEGQPVLLGHQPRVEGFEYVLLDPDRRFPLLALTLAFAVAVVLLGGWRGLFAIVGLAATILILFFFVVPAIVKGRDPLLVSLVGSVLIAYAALYLSHGFTPRTTIALLGTIGGLLCATLFAVAFMGFAHLTGFASEEALYVSAVGAQIDLRGLILGGMMIGALGAIDDMTVTQASAVWELHDANPTIPAHRLVRAGMRIGRDHVASTVNTLLLAYAGASMPLFILFVLSDQPPTTIANGEIVATEIVRTLVGSIGLVASVPITTWLAVRAITGQRRRGRRHQAPPVPVAEFAPESVGPEEHPIPEHRRDVWAAWRRRRRDRS